MHQVYTERVHMCLCSCVCRSCHMIMHLFKQGAFPPFQKAAHGRGHLREAAPTVASLC